MFIVSLTVTKGLFYCVKWFNMKLNPDNLSMYNIFMCFQANNECLQRAWI